MVQLPFPGSELGQLFVCANCAVAEMLEMVTAVDCVLVSVAVCAGLVFACGAAVVTVRGARDRPGDPADGT